jgi:hypothetical protein
MNDQRDIVGVPGQAIDELPTPASFPIAGP